MDKSIIWNWPDCRLELGKRTLVMGILNVTPDSFSDGGRYITPQLALEHARRMVEEGADLIDVGGESTRPGSSPVSAEEELNRVLPVLELLKRELPVAISVDTYKAVTAREAIKAGVHIINDVGGGIMDPDMPRTVAEGNVPVIIMHNPHKPGYRDVLADVLAYLDNSRRAYELAGLGGEKIMLDPGIGFGKNLQENLRLLAELKSFKSLGKPILLGVSRKTFIGQVLDLPVKDRLEGSLAAAAWGVVQGVEILRVHDVKETVRVVRLLEAIMEAGEKE